MRPLSFPHAEARERLVAQVEEFCAAASSLDDLALLGHSRCEGWSRLDASVHVLEGLQEMAIATASRTTCPPDHDAASYWSSHPDDRDADPVAHLLRLRRTASSYGRPGAAIAHLQAVAAGALNAVRLLPETPVAWQRKVLTSGNFLATWVVELAVHQLDLRIEGNTPSGLGWARGTLEALAARVLPTDLDDRTAVLLGLGRELLPADQTLPLGFPVSL